MLDRRPRSPGRLPGSGWTRHRHRRQHRRRRAGDALPARAGTPTPGARPPGAHLRDARAGKRRPPTATRPGRPRSRPTTPARPARASTRRVGWFAGCDAGPGPAAGRPTRVDGVGDEAMLFVLRTWDEPGDDDRRRRRPHRPAHHHDGDARVTGGQRPDASDARPAARRRPSTACATLPGRPAPARTGARARATSPPLPVGAGARDARRGRPAAGDAAWTRPWVGTEPRQARHNAAATSCDDADFSTGVDEQQPHPLVRDPRRAAARPVRAHRDRRLAARRRRPRRSSTTVRDQLATCADKPIGTEVHAAAPTRRARAGTSPSGTSRRRSATTRRSSS